MTSHTWQVEMHVPALRYAITFFLQFTLSFATPTFSAILLGRSWNCAFSCSKEGLAIKLRTTLQ